MVKDGDGRPRVRDANGQEAGFLSISHSRGLVAVGVARHPIGIDVEIIDDARLARSGGGLLQALSDRIEGTATITRRNFYSGWTLYEAALKSGASFKEVMKAPRQSVAAETLWLAGGFAFSLVLRQASPSA